MTQDPGDPFAAAWDRVSTATADPSYDTPLSPSEEQSFQAWKAKYAPKDSGADYDLRGAFKAGLQPDPQTGHWPDTFKKPNHPTFSDESKYAKDRPDLAGSWNGETYVPPKKGAYPFAEAWDRAVPAAAPQPQRPDGIANGFPRGLDLAHHRGTETAPVETLADGSSPSVADRAYQLAASGLNAIPDIAGATMQLQGRLNSKMAGMMGPLGGPMLASGALLTAGGQAVQGAKLPDVPGMEGGPEAKIGGGLGFMGAAIAAPEAAGLEGIMALTPGAIMGAATQGTANYDAVLAKTGDADKAMTAMLEGAAVGGSLGMTGLTPAARVLARLNLASGGVLVRSLKDIGAGIGIGAAQSSINDAIMEHATGEDLPILKNAVEAGAFGGLTMAIGGGIAHALGAHAAPSTDQAPAEPPLFSGVDALNKESQIEQPAEAAKSETAPPESGVGVDGAAPEQQPAASKADAAPPIGQDPEMDEIERWAFEEPSYITPKEGAVPAEMPKGKQIGTDLTGEPVYSKQERGDIGRAGEGVKAPAESQVGMFDEHGGLFEKQAAERDQGKPQIPLESKAKEQKSEIPLERAPEPEKPAVPLEAKPKAKIPLRKKGQPKEVQPLDVELIREHLRYMAEHETGQAQVGGELIFGQEGDAKREVVGRTKWVSKAAAAGDDWWTERPGKMSVERTQRAVEKALKGEKLGTAEQEMVDYMTRVATARMTSGYHATLDDLHEAQRERAAIQGENKSINRKVEVAPGVSFSTAKYPGLLGKVFDLLTAPHDVKVKASDVGELRTPDEINQAHEILDRHLGERQVRETEVAIRSRKHLEEIAAATKGGQSERAKTRAAMQLYIDSKDAGGVEAAAAAHPGWDPESPAGGLPGGVNATKGDIVERAKNLSPKLRGIADKIAAESHAEGETFKAEGLIGTAHENYSTRIWAPDEPKPATGGKVGKLATSAMQQKARSLDSIFHGWEIGKELQTFDVAKSQHVASSNLYQVRADKGLLAEGVKAGVLSTTKEPGWVEIQHPNAQKYVVAGAAKAGKAYSELETFNRNLHATDDGTLLLRQPLYAPPDVADKLNAIVGQSRMANAGGKFGEFLKGYDKYNRYFKEQILSFSGFHAITFVRAHVLGTSLEGLNPVKAWTEGKRVQDEFGPIAQRAVRAGLRLQGAPDFDEFVTQEKTRLGKVIDAIPGAKATKDAMKRTSNAITDFTFQQLGPRLKMWNYMISEQENLRRGMSADEAAKAAATLTNDRFGGLNLERMGRNKTFQHGLHMFALAPDWTESNLRAAALAFKAGDAQAGYRTMWANVLYRGVLATVVGNYVLSGFDSKKFRDSYQKAWDAGNLRWLDLDITPIYRAAGGTDPGEKYLSTLGHFTIPLRAAADPLKFIKNRASVAGSTAFAALSGRDWADRPFTSFEEFTGQDPRGKLKGQTVSDATKESGAIGYSQFPSFLVNRVRSLAPIPFQNAAAFLMGETDAFDSLIKSVGLPEATVQPSSLFHTYKDQIDREYQAAKNGKTFELETAGWSKAANKVASNVAKLRAAGDEKGAQALMDEFNTAFRRRRD